MIMMRVLPLLLFSLISLASASVTGQTILAKGAQPQVTVDADGIVRLVFGENEKIYYSTSTNGGTTFSKPVGIGEVSGMHLGMTRGPQLATSRDKSLVTAMDKQGNIHAFILDHLSHKWKKIENVNDVYGSAPEGLMSITADDRNNFYGVWLDIRKGHQNNISFAVLHDQKWSSNKLVYVSTESHVCECCQPAIAVKNDVVSIMFRNWLKGSRDLFVTTSQDGGKTFSEAQKLGNGTWVLNGCPMDGGGLSIDSQSAIHTAWQRDGVVYYAQTGKSEQQVGTGRHVSLNGNLISWQQGPDLFMTEINGTPGKLAEGSDLDVVRLRDNSIVAVWEKDDQIVFKKTGG